MSTWTVVACLLTLRGEFNTVSPGRDKGADGTIANAAHTSTSDHTPDEDSTALRGKDADKINEVHALDIDSSGPWPGGWAWFDKTIKDIVAEEKRRWLDPDDMCRLEYVIWNKVIYSRSFDFKPRTYEGSDPHTNHAHFSARYETRTENDTRPWGVAGEDDDMPNAKEVAQELANFEVWNPYTKRMQKLSEIWGYTPSRSPHETTWSKLDAISAVLLKASQDGDVDEAEVARLVLTGLTPEMLAAAFRAAGLTPESIAAAIPDDMADRVVDILAGRLSGNH